MWRTRNIREGRGGGFDRGTHAETRPLSPQKGAGPCSSVRSLSLFQCCLDFLSLFFFLSLFSAFYRYIQSAGCCCSLFELSRTRTLYPQTTASLEKRRQFLFPVFFFLLIALLFLNAHSVGCAVGPSMTQFNAYCRSRSIFDRAAPSLWSTLASGLL